MTRVWQPKPPKLTSKQKVAYVMAETGLPLEGAIAALQDAAWNIRDAIMRCEAHR